MHLLYITAALPFSLEETYIVPEIMEVQKRGHQVTVIPVRPGRAVFHEDARLLIGVTIAERILSVTVLANALAELAGAPLAVMRSALLLARSRSVRMLLKNLIVFPKALWVGRIARRHGVDHIHAHFASTPGTVALLAGHLSGIPWSFTAHRWDIAENNLLDQKARAAQFVRAIDTRGGKELAALAGLEFHRVRVIHMGVALPLVCRSVRSRPRRPLRVLLAARFDEFKGHSYAVDAVARLKAAGVEVWLDCAGDGPLKTTIEKYAITRAVRDRVNFPGSIDHQALLGQLRSHRWDVALLPSVETSESREGIPVFLIEAMAAGVPVVATHTGGIPELIDRSTGILVGQQNARAIAEALATLVADDNLYRQVATAGVRRVRDEFAIEATVSALIDQISLGPAGITSRTIWSNPEQYTS